MTLHQKTLTKWELALMRFFDSSEPDIRLRYGIMLNGLKAVIRKACQRGLLLGR